MLDKRRTAKNQKTDKPEPNGAESHANLEVYAEIESSNLFDGAFYIKTYSDVRIAGIDPLYHYVRWGRIEGRKPSSTFDPLEYLRANPDLAGTIDPFLHYVRRGHATGRPRSPLEKFGRTIGLDKYRLQAALENCNIDRLLILAANNPEFWNQYAFIDKSGLFDVDYYRGVLPILDGELDPLAHYMIWGYRSFMDPSSNFSGIEYYTLHPDVRQADSNPLLHYLLHGKREARPTSQLERESKRSYASAYPIGLSSAEEIAKESMLGVSYLYRHGLTLDKSSSLEHIDQAIDDLASSHPTFMTDSLTSPDATIIIPTYGLLPALLNCLDSLASQASKFSAEIIVVDDASPDETLLYRITKIPWVRCLRQKRNKGFIASCNAGASEARGRFLVFLNNDTRVLPHWLDELIGSFQIFPKAGLVGSKLINEDETLQDAGGIVWRDGTVWNYGRGEDPTHPAYCFARQVDYCSGASIAVSAEAWTRVGGFDATYAPAYCEDTDLAFALRRLGYEIWLQPLSMVIHYEGRSHGRDANSDIKGFQVRNLEKFYARWRGDVIEHGLPEPRPYTEANRRTQLRVLVLDAQTPTPDRDSGSVNADQLIRLFLHMGWHVSFAPRNHLFAGTYTRALQRIGVETLIAPHVNNIRELIAHRTASYDYIVAFRFESLDDCYEEWRTCYPTARIIFHDVDLHYLRLQRKAELLGDRSLRIRAELARDTELELFAKADCSVVVTKAEKDIIQSQIPINNIVVYPYTIGIRRSQRPFEDRRHLCFIGSFAHDPNVDAVTYFVEEIWPIVKPKLPLAAKFLIVGTGAPESVRRLVSDDVVVMGHVPDLDVVTDDCRLSVAPIRYGAGIKGKLVRSLAHGLPSVATTLSVEGMELINEQQILVADTPKTFARAITRLYHNRTLWRRLQEAGYLFVEEHYSWEVGLNTLNRIMDVADETWIARKTAARQARWAKQFEPDSSHGLR